MIALAPVAATERLGHALREPCFRERCIPQVRRDEFLQIAGGDRNLWNNLHPAAIAWEVHAVVPSGRHQVPV